MGRQGSFGFVPVQSELSLFNGTILFHNYIVFVGTHLILNFKHIHTSFLDKLHIIHIFPLCFLL